MNVVFSFFWLPFVPCFLVALLFRWFGKVAKDKEAQSDFERTAMLAAGFGFLFLALLLPLIVLSLLGIGDWG